MILSGGYFSLCMVTQYVQRYSCYPSRYKNIIGEVLTFARYAHCNKCLPGNISGFILKTKMTPMDVSLMAIKDFYTIQGWFSCIES